MSTAAQPLNASVASSSEYQACSVIFVLGGPAAGKGTQCALLAEKYGFVHLSVGDVLRAEIGRPDSLYGPIIKENMLEGRVGPMEITVTLLRDAISRTRHTEATKYLIDGFPRRLDQALLFERTITAPEAIVVLQCPASVLQQRLQGRAHQGRFDDNLNTIEKRIDTFNNVTKEVLEHYAGQGKVAEIAAVGSREEVLERLEAVLSLAPRPNPTTGG